ncbi:clostripain [Sphingobacterium phlebotomi]|uniref:Clostripain n=1 Tax=Sphingobacterium phlebotomi TaxID=2605433 RepID=A0A5D4H8H1_9SPHI|nr:clostripain-related cysteine peptidase [Sphingobacterium phlebotomi]TYR37431.1 clostripain [Sphingobacterium phlebotomi]
MNVMKRAINNEYNLLFLLILFAIGISSCNKKEDIDPLEEYAEHMTLVYISANNDLRSEAIKSINLLQKGFTKEVGGKLLIYAKMSPNVSYMLAIKPNIGGNLTLDTLKIYNNTNSADPHFLKQVIHESRQLAPAKSYSLVLWSHASSWQPPQNLSVTTKSFGVDSGVEMDIKDLSSALPEDFDFLMFDACSMASIEVCFQLKSKARYILASPSEVLSTGFPYETISNDFFLGSTGLQSIAQKFIDYYRKQPGIRSSATISLIKTDLLDDVALQTAKLLSNKPPVPDYNKSDIQKLNFDPKTEISAYDFISFLSHNYHQLDYIDLKESISNAVVFSASTDSFFGNPIEDFCGLSVYLPESGDVLKPYYASLAWSQQTGWDKLFTD